MNLTIPIKESFNQINEFSRSGEKLDPCRGVVWHYTGSNGEADADNIDGYFDGLKRQDSNDDVNDIYAGAHIQLDRDEKVQSIPFDEVAFHCGGTYRPGITDKLGIWPNKATWGVEICEDVNDLFPEETFANAVELGAFFIIETRPGGSLAHLAAWPLTTADFYRHYDITGKVCPLPWVRDPAEWERFLQAINEKVSIEGDEDNMPMKMEEWQWKMLGDSLDGLYKKGLLTDYTWAIKAYNGELTAAELAWLNTIIYARQQGISV